MSLPALSHMRKGERESEQREPAAEVRDMLQPGVRFGECVITGCQSRKAAPVMQIEFSFHPYIMDCPGVSDVGERERTGSLLVSYTKTGFSLIPCNI